MKTLFMLVCLILHSCGAGGIFHSDLSQETVCQLPISKQRQRIAFLQKKVELTEKELHKLQNEFDQLSIGLQRSQLALIEKQIERHEKQAKKMPFHSSTQLAASKENTNLFLEERETLQRMLENGPSPEAFEAQIVLDKILRVITEDSF